MPAASRIFRGDFPRSKGPALGASSLAFFPLAEDGTGKTFWVPWPGWGVAIAVDDAPALRAFVQRAHARLTIVVLAGIALTLADCAAAWVCSQAGFAVGHYLWRLATACGLCLVASPLLLWAGTIFAVWRRVRHRPWLSLSGHQSLQVLAQVRGEKLLRALLLQPLLWTQLPLTVGVATLVALSWASGDHRALGVALQRLRSGQVLGWAAAWLLGALAHTYKFYSAYDVGRSHRAAEKRWQHPPRWALRCVSLLAVLGGTPGGSWCLLNLYRSVTPKAPATESHVPVMHPEMVWLDPGWPQDLRVRVVRSTCRPTAQGIALTVDYQLMSMSAKPIAIRLKPQASRLILSVMTSPQDDMGATQASGEVAVQLQNHADTTCRTAQFVWPDNDCAHLSGPLWLVGAQDTTHSLQVALQPTPAPTAAATAADPACASTQASSPVHLATALAPVPLSLLERTDAGCQWWRQEVDGQRRSIGKFDRPCHRMPIALDTHHLRAAISHAPHITLWSLQGRPAQRIDNPVAGTKTATLVAFDATDALVASVVQQQQDGGMFLRLRHGAAGWQPLGPALPREQLGSSWAARAWPLAPSPFASLLHPGQRSAQEPWLPSQGDLAAADAWKPLDRSQLPALPQAPPGRRGAWAQRQAGGSRVMAWRGDNLDPSTVQAPILRQGGGQTRQLLAAASAADFRDVEVAIYADRALIFTRAVNPPQRPMQLPTSPPVQIDLRTGETLTTFAADFFDVRFWPPPASTTATERGS